MWFKNAQIYRLPAPWPTSLAVFEMQIARGLFTGCPSNQPSARGWVQPRRDSSLVYALNNQWLIALAIEERLLPKDVVRKEVANRADALEAQQGYTPGRKQLRELTERVTEELMPKAFTRTRRTWAWIDPVNGWLVIDAATPAKGEEVIDHLRLCLDALPLSRLHTTKSPQTVMADCLAGGDVPVGFTIDRECELKAVGEEKATVRYSKHPLDGDTIEAEIKEHLASGKLPTKLALTWDDRLSFVLTEKGEIKGLAFLDLVKEQAEGENADEQFDADFALMTGELSRFLPQLVTALGEEVFEE